MTHTVKISVRGRSVTSPSATINGKIVIAAGRFLRLSSLMDEDMLEGEPVSNLDLFLRRLNASDLRADLFTFTQRLPNVTPQHTYHLEWDSAAVIPITTYQDWWQNRAMYDARKAVKRAVRRGVVVRLADFDDNLIKGIQSIYNESPVRQGRMFWHYRKDLETIKRETGTYRNRSAFIGAYFEGELIGFIKMVYVGTVATTVHVIGQMKHFDKRPMNALIAKAVEICERKGMSHLMYGKYRYRNQSNSLTEFKRRSGFEEVLIPRHYVPLTAKGRVALKLNLHREVAELIPQPLLVRLQRVRNLWYRRKTAVRHSGGQVS